MEIIITTTAHSQLIDITERVNEKIGSENIDHGICLVYVPHTTAAVTINENADPSVAVDMESVLNKLIPWEDGYTHLEGNSSAHVKATLCGASELVMVKNKRLVLGRWQGIFFCEFDGPRTRKVYLDFFSA